MNMTQKCHEVGKKANLILPSVNKDVASKI